MLLSCCRVTSSTSHQQWLKVMRKNFQCDEIFFLFFWSMGDDELEDSETDAGRYSSPQPSHLHPFSTSFFHFLATGERWEDLIADNFRTGPVKKNRVGRKKNTAITFLCILSQGDLWAKMAVNFNQGNTEINIPVGAFTAGILVLWLFTCNPNIPLNATCSPWKLCSEARLLLGTSATDSTGKVFFPFYTNVRWPVVSSSI